METFLLDRESKSILEIIACVGKSPTKELSFSDIEKKLGFSFKTIKTYLNTLRTYCQDNHLEVFTIENNHIKMSGQSNFNVFELYHYLTQSSVKYKILTTIFKNKDITFTALYLDLLISRSTASAYIRQINQEFEPYHCKIKFSKKRTIQGEEHQIRFLYHNIFWGLDLNDVIPDSTNIDAVLTQLLTFVPHMTYAVLSRIRLYFYIFQVRSADGYFITKEDAFKIADMPYITYGDFFETLNDFGFFKYCPDQATQQKEGRYLYFIFSCINLLTLESIKSIDFKTSLSSSPDVHYVVSQFQQRTLFDLSQDDLNFLYYNLALLHQEANIFRGRSKIFGATEAINKMTAQSSSTMNFLFQFLKELCQDSPTINKLFKNFPALYYSYIILLKTLIEQHRQPLKLLVQSSLSLIFRELMINKVITSTSSPIQIYTSDQLKGEKPDAIISDFTPENKYRDVPFFSTSLFYSDWNQTDFDLFLSRLADDKNKLFRLPQVTSSNK